MVKLVMELKRVLVPLHAILFVRPIHVVMMVVVKHVMEQKIVLLICAQELLVVDHVPRVILAQAPVIISVAE
jgi:hypothetical protein